MQCTKHGKTWDIVTSGTIRRHAFKTAKVACSMYNVSYLCCNNKIATIQLYFVTELKFY